MSTPDRRGMLDRADMALSIRRPCMLLGIARSGVYRPPRPANDNDLALMRRLDELFTVRPFLGSRRMTAMLKAEGLQVNRKRGQRLMRKMGIAALGPRPNTTRPAPGGDGPPHGRSSIACAQNWQMRVRCRPGSSTGIGVSSQSSRGEAWIVFSS